MRIELNNQYKTTNNSSLYVTLALYGSYVKQKKWDDARLLAFGGSKALLEAQQYGSGADLAMQYIDILNHAPFSVQLEDGGGSYGLI